MGVWTIGQNLQFGIAGSLRTTGLSWARPYRQLLVGIKYFVEKSGGDPTEFRSSNVYG